MMQTFLIHLHIISLVALLTTIVSRRLLRGGVLPDALRGVRGLSDGRRYVLHSPCRQYGLPSNMMALITSGCG